MALPAFAHPTPLLTPNVPTFTRINPPRCAATPPQADSLRTTYKSAKAAYKSAKRAQLPTPQLTNLQTTYKQAKAAYKASKYPPTPLYTESTTPPPPSSKYPPTPIYTQTTTPTPTPSQQQQSNVTVCGGPSCKRLGADSVAAMLRLPTPQAKCMKRCGGVGPTLSINNQPQKVNFRKALSDALRTAADDYQNQ